MSLWRQILYGIRKLIFRRDHDQQLADEVQHYFEEAVKEKIARGISENQALKQVRLELGNPLSARESVREYGWENHLEIFFTDLRLTFRRLRKNPSFTITSVLTLALGIGATTTIFSVVNKVLIQPLPFTQSDRLVALTHTAPGVGMKVMEQISPSLYFTYLEHNQTLEGIGLWNIRTQTVTELMEPEEVTVLAVTHLFLPILNVNPLFGRAFTPADDDARNAKSVLLTFDYWQSHFGSAQDVVGKNITLDGNSYEIRGVLPSSFRFMDQKFSLLSPLQFRRDAVHLGDFSHRGIGRLKPGITLEQANTDIRRMIPLASRIFPPSPGFNSTMLADAKVAPVLMPLKDNLIGNTGDMLWILMTTISIVLLIACTNIANLLLVRSEGRYQEFIVRKALGESSGRLACELFMESISLGIMGGFIGLVIAYAALQTLTASGISNLPRLEEIYLDIHSVVFSICIAILSGISFGLIPVWRYAKPNISLGLRGSGRTQSQNRDQQRTRSILIVCQVALALILLISSGLMVRTSWELSNIDPGFKNPNQLQTFRISIPHSQVQEREKVLRMQNDILDRISLIPGVTSVAFSSQLPLEGGVEDPVYAEDYVHSINEMPGVRRHKGISPEFFSTIGAKIIEGRDISWEDIYTQKQVAIITENFARELWQTPALALGKRLRNNFDEDWSEVIGIVSDLHDDGMNQAPPQVAYWPTMRKYSAKSPPNITRNVSYLIRSDRTNSSTFIQELRQAVAAVNPNLPIANISTLGEVYSRSMAKTTFATILLIIAGSLSLILGVIGIYGVIAYSVSQRIREIGIRVALGAPLKNVAGIFVRYGIILCGVGTFIGLIASFFLSRLMHSLLFGVSATDLATYFFATLCLFLASLAASYIPARRAAKVDPAVTLRAE